VKLLLENWRGYLAEQEEQAIGTVSEKGINTVGDLKKAIKLMRLKAVGGEAGKKAAEALIGMLPGGGTAMSIFSGVKDTGGMLKKIYGADDSVKTGTGLDKLNVDDDVSAIVDDPIEVAYLNYLMKDKFAKAPPEQSLEDFDATLGLQQFLAVKFNKTTVRK
tara:strand:+ start:161 stop:646 length:486 start_codon:yes stop_codon:yes gene_type:complete